MKKISVVFLIVAVCISAICLVIAADNIAMGDVNSDGGVDSLDAAQVLKHDAMLISLEDTVLADVNSDGSADSLDAALILKYDAGLITDFGNIDIPAESESSEISFDAVIEESSEASVSTEDVSDITFESTEESLEAVISEESSEDMGLLESSEEESSEEESSEEESSEEVVIAPQEQYGTYTVKTFDSVETVDWSVVNTAPIDTYKWVNSVTYDAYAQLVYVKDWGFICRMTCMESDPPAQYTQFGDPVYLDSCMEFFAAWDNQSYINIESNSIGALVCQYGPTKANRKPATDYLSMGQMIQTNPQIGEDSWTLTIELPLSKLQAFYGNKISAATFVSGYSFKGNFYKIGSDPISGVRHYGMWNEVGTSSPDFHQPAYFGSFVME